MPKIYQRKNGPHLSPRTIRALRKLVPELIVTDNRPEFHSKRQERTIVEMDHTQLDVWLVDDIAGCRRPTMTVVRVHGGENQQTELLSTIN